METVLAVVADLHVGSRVGLCPPRVELDGGGVYEANVSQQALWDAWCEFWGRDVRERRGKGSLAILVLGDLVERLGTASSWANSIAEEVQAAVLALEEARKLCGGWDRLYVLRGTPWHVGEGGGAEEEIARRLNAVPGGDGRRSRHRLLLNCGGVLVDAAHSAWGAYRQWTAGGNASRLAAEVLSVCAEFGQPVPHLVLRAHMHRVSDSGETFRDCRALVCPAFTLTSEFAHSKGVVRPADVGGVIVRLPRLSVEVVRKDVVEERLVETW